MSKHEITNAEEVGPGDHLVVEVKGKEIGIFNIDGEYHAYSNWCVHQGGPICEGKVTGTTKGSFDHKELETKLEYCKEGEIINCPWHGWEYDVVNGECLSRNGVKLPKYNVDITDGKIVVEL